MSQRNILLLIMSLNCLCVMAQLKFVSLKEDSGLWVEFFIEGYFSLEVLPVAILDLTSNSNLNNVLPKLMSHIKNTVFIFDEVPQYTYIKASVLILKEEYYFVNNDEIFFFINEVFQENWSRILFWFMKPIAEQTEQVIISQCTSYFISPIVVVSCLKDNSIFSLVATNNVLNIKNNHLNLKFEQKNVKSVVRKVIQNVDKLDRDFDGAVLRVKAHPKYVMLQQNERKELFGVDAFALYRTSKMLNFTVRLVMGIKNHFGNTYPNGSYVSSIADLKTHKIDLNINRHVMIRLPEVMMLPVLDMENFCFILPYFRGHFTVTSLVRYLSPTTWALVLVSALLSATVWRLFNAISKTEDYPVLSLLQSFLTSKRFKIRHPFHMVFFASWDAFVFILITIFRGTVLKSIIKPFWVDEITNMEELLRSNLKIKNRIGLFQVAQPNTTLGKLLDRSTVSYLIETDDEFRTSAYFTSKYFRFFLDIVLGGKDHYYTIPDCVSDCSVCYFLASRSPYFNGLQRNILNLQQYGFYKAWFQYFQYKSHILEEDDDSFYFGNSTKVEKRRPFTIQDLILAFYIHAIGILFSVVLFLCEVMLNPWNEMAYNFPFVD